MDDNIGRQVCWEDVLFPPGLISTFFDLAVKIIICSVYVVRVVLDNPDEYAW